MTPTDELITSIIDELATEGLVSVKAADGLRKKLALGMMTAGDWRNLVGTDTTDQENPK